MFFVDDILFFPAKGIWFCFQKIHELAEEEGDSSEATVAELQDLYRLLESGGISEEEFDAREAVLLDMLEEVESAEA